MTEFERIYLAYFRYVYLYIKSLSKDEHIAEDITSEAFMKAMKSIDSFNGTCDIRVWLCQIGKNSYYSWLRKNRRMASLEEVPEKADPADLEKEIADKESSMKVHRILHRLEEPYKEVFTLRCFGGLSFREIAALFCKTENWACVTYHRARKKIRERMEEEYESGM